MSMKKSLLTCLIVCSSAGAFAAGSVITSGSAINHHLPNPAKFTGRLYAQGTITGTVRDSTGTTLAGVSVIIKGTTTGTQTDVNGKFSLSANPGDILVFSYVGYNTRQVVVGTETNIVVTLGANSGQLNEVVVTALGIKRSSRSLTYATQTISSDAINTVKTDNLMNSLSGKVAGVTISPSASGVGGSTKVELRGIRSFAGSNQPLYVIDGVPLGSPSNGSQPTSIQGGSPDGGDGISNLNPEDIESITVLEGASASALYGSQASNGVILITTKKGKAGKTQINFSSSFQASNAVSLPKFQNQYGQTPSASDSYGPAISDQPHNNLKEFFQTGTNFTNAIDLSGGSETAQTYFSYANTTASGVEPKNDLKRNNFNLHETLKLLNNKLTVDGNMAYIDQNIANTPELGVSANPLTGLYLFPRGANILPYKTNYQNLNSSTGVATQNWPNLGGTNPPQQNPWWLINNDPNSLQRNRIIASANVKYDFTTWFNLQVRGNVDRTNDVYNYDQSAGTVFNGVTAPNGAFAYNNGVTEQKYGDIIANFNPKSWGQFKLDGLVGASISDLRTNSLAVGDGANGNNGQLLTPNFFSLSNIFNAAGNPIAPNTYFSHTQTQSIFESANLSYKNWVYLALTNRTEWNSTLAFTPNDHYDYASEGLTFILSQMFTMPQAISYAKVRGSYANVGNGVPFNVTLGQNTQNSSGAEVLNNNAPLKTLKPEMTHSFELGTDWKFIDNRISFSATYYDTHTYNQYFSIQPSPFTLISNAYVNAGDIQNKGFEITLGADVIRDKALTWNTSFNASMNKNKVIQVDDKDGLPLAILTGSGNGQYGYESVMADGGSVGDIYGYTTLKNANGQVVLSGTNASNYAPQKVGTYSYLGNPNPKFQLGWSNSFDFGHFNLNFLVDGKFGGQVLSYTQAEMDYFGVSQASLGNGPNRTVTVNGVNSSGQSVTSVAAKNWYQAAGGLSGITDQYIYSATVVRLREASLGYTWPITNSAIKSVKFSLIGRNLFYFYKKAPFDPEVSTSTGNGLGGVDAFNPPATRNLGFSANVSF